MGARPFEDGKGNIPGTLNSEVMGKDLDRGGQSQLEWGLVHQEGSSVSSG